MLEGLVPSWAAVSLTRAADVNCFALWTRPPAQACGACGGVWLPSREHTRFSPPLELNEPKFLVADGRSSLHFKWLWKTPTLPSPSVFPSVCECVRACKDNGGAVRLSARDLFLFCECECVSCVCVWMCASAGIYVRWLDQAGLMLQPCAVHQCRWKSRSVDTAAHLQSCAATARTHGQWMSRGETAGSWMPCGTRTSLRQNSSNDSTQTTTG